MDMFNLLLRFLENSTIWQILILLKKFTVFLFCFFRMIFRCFLPFLGVCQSLLRPIDLSQFDWRKIKIVNVRKHRFSFSRWHFKTFFSRFTFVLQIFSWSWERMLTISKIFIGPVGSSNDQKCQINVFKNEIDWKIWNKQQHNCFWCSWMKLHKHKYRLHIYQQTRAI